MRTMSLILLLAGTLTFLLPYYRDLLPFEVGLDASSVMNLGSLFVIFGLIGILWSRV